MRLSYRTFLWFKHNINTNTNLLKNVLPTLKHQRYFSTSCCGSNELKTKNIIGITKQTLKQEFEQLGFEDYRVDQVWNWLYIKGCPDFSNMLNMSKEKREILSSKYHISYGEVQKDTLSQDGTRKLLIGFSPDEVETVFIPEAKRGTLCMSSQVGCSMSCSFCFTGTQGLTRNLKSSEIVGQLMIARHLFTEFPKTVNKKIISNVVFMGQGEPFYNYREVSKALSIITDPSGLSISKHKIIVSTCGVAPVIEKLGNDFTGIGLALSLHATNDDLRNILVPSNRQWPLAEVLKACKHFPGISSGNRVTLEYVMLDKINDSLNDARALVRLIDFPSLVNLIPFNPWPGSVYKTSSIETIREFANFLIEKGIRCTVRHPRGHDILAACGCLKTNNLKKQNQSDQSEHIDNTNSNLDSLVLT